MSVVLPEVNFAETDPGKIIDESISHYEKLSGRKLSQSDPVYILILALCEPIVQANAIMNYAAKQNLLYYAEDGMLDHKGYERNTPRIGGDHAVTRIKYVLSSISEKARIIPKGSRVTGDSDLVFATTVEAVINPGAPEIIIPARCELPGTVGNEVDIGELDIMVEPLPFISRVENITVTSGGTEIENDDDFRERIHMSPERLSTAGPEGAYEYHAKKSSPDIEDIDVATPGPGKVHISMMMKGGRLPEEEEINKMLEQVTDRKVRPLTDQVTGGSPVQVKYDLEAEYFIDKNAVDKTIIKNNIEAAIKEYKVWQSSKIGRDINPSTLINMCMQAGAKRVVVTNPVFTVVNKGEVAIKDYENVVFGGEEDD